MNTGADNTDALAGTFLAGTEESCSKTRNFVEKKRAEVESKTDTSKTTLAGDTEGIKVAVKDQSEVYVKSSEGLKGKLKMTVDEVREVQHPMQYSKSYSIATVDEIKRQAECCTQRYRHAPIYF